MITSRRICWPDPDATCLEGGCIHCNGHRMRSVNVIRRYAERAGVLRNRAVGEKPAIEAFRWGEDSGWPDVDTKEER